MKRPTELGEPELKFTKLIKISLVVAPETPTSVARWLLWVGIIESEIVDEGPAPQLSFNNSKEDSSEEDTDEDFIGSLAKELRGELWDSENMQWKRG